MGNLDAGLYCKILAGNVIERSHARRAVIYLAWIGFCVRNELREVPCGERRMYRKCTRRGANAPDRREVFADVVTDLLIEAGRNRERAAISEKNCVPVRRAS